MLAAQCSKLSSKSPPPLADAAVGKGFHPWKKSGGGGNNNTSSSGTTATSSTTTTSGTNTSSAGFTNGQTNGQQQQQQQQQQRATSSTPSSITTNSTTATTPTSGSTLTGYHHQRPGSNTMGGTTGTTNAYGAGDLYFPHTHQTDMYSRGPYDSAWQFQQHVKQETAVTASVNGSSWWDMHQAAAANGWLADMTGGVAAGVSMPSHMHAAAAAAAAYSAGDYSASLAAAGSTAHLLASTGQHLLQDTYKSMQQHHAAAAAAGPFGVAGLGGPTGHQAATAATVVATAHQVKVCFSFYFILNLAMLC